MLHAGQAHVTSFHVTPSLPAALKPLERLASNLLWAWRPSVREVFERLDPDSWQESKHNPTLLLTTAPQSSFDRAAADPSYTAAVDRAAAELDSYLGAEDTWFSRTHASLPPADGSPAASNPLIAYFCAEFGLVECLQIYSGGLGVLAGDHLKSASDLGVPLIGVGLLYRHGYFSQRLSPTGWQEEFYPPIAFEHQPIAAVIDEATGAQLRVAVEFPGRVVEAAVWECHVGRVRLFLLDTDVAENLPHDRGITGSLYGGDTETRIQQELILGVGGVRALGAMGVDPTVFHMNEGHSAFLAIERISQLRESSGLAFDEALTATSAGQVFTTHTPVPAGIDRFDPELVRRYLGSRVDDLGLRSIDDLIALGREHPEDPNEFFSMAVLALRASVSCNGVSKLHGRVSRAMWRSVWPGLPEPESPIGHVTNGVHAPTWLAPSFSALYTRACGADWSRSPCDAEPLVGFEGLPDASLWSTHTALRAKLIAEVQSRLAARGLPQDTAASLALSPDALTVGFARRFATYKRSTLLLLDPDRLSRLLTSTSRPVQFLIAGKAHPADSAGKELIQSLVQFSSAYPQAGARVVFLEDYDMELARFLVQGCDVWLNTPRRGMEASGTSGMKAALNGVINASILDGWWDEAYSPEVGFAVGSKETPADPQERDEAENRSLLDLFEHRIVPEFYSRGTDGVPTQWARRMKRCVSSLAPFFNTDRMVAGYTEAHYLPAHAGSRAAQADGYSPSRSHRAQLNRLSAHWDSVEVQCVSADIADRVLVGSDASFVATVHLGGLSPADVTVQVYHGALLPSGDLTDCLTFALEHTHDLGDGRHSFSGSFAPKDAGRRGFTVRIVPNVAKLLQPIAPGLIRWHNAEASPRLADAEASRLPGGC